MSDDRGELLANPCQLLLALREWTAAHSSHAQELELADALADLAKEPLDLSLPVHATSLPRGDEGRVSGA